MSMYDRGSKTAGFTCLCSRNVVVLEMLYKVRIPLNAEEWGLYDSKPGVDEAVRDMKKSLEMLFAAGGTLREIFVKGCTVMEKYADFGAMDTAPRYVWERIVKQASKVITGGIIG